MNSMNSTNSTNSTNTRNSRNPVAEIFRAVTRPAVTIIFAATIAQVVVERIDAPQWFIGLAGTCIGWWFVDRTRQHIKEKHVLERSEGKE